MSQEFKLSKTTNSIIENFSKINEAMVFTEGNVLRVVAKDADIFGFATIPETIPDKFAINSLPKFLGVLGLYDDPILKSDGKTISIKGSGNRKFSYTLSNEKLITTFPIGKYPGDIVKMPPTVGEFDMSKDDLISLKKNMLVAALSAVTFSSDGKNITVKASNASDPTSDEYSAIVGSCGTKFNITFVDRKIRNMFDDDYKVTVTDRIVRFKSNRVDYYNAPEIGSKVD